MRIHRPIILVLLIACTSTGCSYLEARGRNFADCWKASVGLGLGIESHVQVGPLGVGAGVWGGWCWGLEGKKIAGEWSEWDVGIPIPQVIGLISLAKGRNSGHLYALLTGIEDVHLHKWDSSCIHYITANFLLLPAIGIDTHHEIIRESYAKIRWVDYFWLAGSARCFVGVKFGFNLAEFADFLLGWFGVDICGDDDREADDQILRKKLEQERLRSRLEHVSTPERLKSEELLKRVRAVEKMGATMDLKTGRRLAGLLKSADPEIRWAAMNALSYPGDRNVFEDDVYKDEVIAGAVLASLKDPVPSIRRDAIHLLGRMKCEKAVEPLVALLRDGDSDVSGSVIGALLSLGNSVKHHLPGMLLDADYWRRSAAAGIARRLDARNCREAILASLRTYRICSPISIFEAVEHFRIEEAIPIVREINEMDLEYIEAAKTACRCRGCRIHKPPGMIKWDLWWKTNTTLTILEGKQGR